MFVVEPATVPKDLPGPPIYSKVNPADTPNLTLALTAIGIPTGSFTLIFAASRTLGRMVNMRTRTSRSCPNDAGASIFWC